MRKRGRGEEVSFRGILGAAMDLVWPRRCAVEGCGRKVDRPGRYICSSCFAALPYHDRRGCRICGAVPEADEPNDFVCADCLESPPPFEFSRSAIRHEFAGRQLVLDLKFRRWTWLREDLVDLLEGAARAKLDVSAVDVVVPVPLHRWRRFTRRFNQAALLAEGLAARIGRLCLPDALRRVRDTGHQSRLGAKARRDNVKGAFEACRPECLRGRTVLLIDDVSTTGSTLFECAAVLKKAGAARVWCLTVSRSVRE